MPEFKASRLTGGVLPCEHEKLSFLAKPCGGLFRGRQIGLQQSVEYRFVAVFFGLATDRFDLIDPSLRGH